MNAIAQFLLADDTVAMRYRLKFTSRASGKSVRCWRDSTLCARA
jgi:hypothetical protein